LCIVNDEPRGIRAYDPAVASPACYPLYKEVVTQGTVFYVYLKVSRQLYLREKVFKLIR